MTEKFELMAKKDVEILVVEDSPTQAEELRYLLEGEGYRVRVAGNGVEGLAALRERRPTVVVSDIVMPEMDGYALCRTIKADAGLRDLPVVIVTSLSSIHDIARSLECGADNFIRKPYDPQMLLARINYILLNLELRRNRKISIGLELYLHGKKHFVTSEREQIVDLLISTYEEAVHMNEELQARQQEIARSNQTLATLYRIADEVNGVSTENEVCTRALQAATELPQFQGGWIFLADEEGEDCRLAASINLPPALELPAQAGDCACWRQLRAGAGNGAVLVDCERLRGVVAAGCHASIPLRGDHRCLGVINLLGGPRAAFDDEDLSMLEAIGNVVAVALERARLYQHMEALVIERTAKLQAEVLERTRAEARVARLNRVYAVLSGINSTIVRVSARHELFADACRIAVEHGGFGLAWVGLRDRESPRLRRVTGNPALAGNGDIELAPDSLFARAMAERRVVVCRDVADECGAAMAAGFRALAVLPLCEGGQPVGVLALYADESSLFDDEEMALLDELAGDISFSLESLAMAERLNYLAYYDVLTGLPNRGLVLDRIRQGASLVQRHHSALAVVCLDIDRFRVINDGLGRHVGDRVLETVARRLQGCLRDGDSAGRLGTDEFVLVCSEVAGEADVTTLVDAVFRALDEPIVIDGQELHITVSAGSSLCPRDGDDPDRLLKCADLARKQAKESGRHSHRCFTAELDTRASEQLHVESRLAEALERGEFEVYYQPQVSAQSGAIAGMEALVRWNHPEHGLVLPSQFIPIAEESGLIVALGEWVLKEACRQARAWLDEELGDFPMSVNLSMAQFRDNDLLGGIDRTLAECGLDPRYLELELTETVVMANPEMVIGFLQELKGRGIQVSIDDFGTGYSSLNYLKRLPVDRLKVDYSFVRDITRDPGSASICRAIIAIAHNLRLGVVAEGVESEAQATYLARHYCDTLQGFHLSPPLPAAEATALLRRRAPLLPLPAERPSRRTLLLLDDEEPVRNALVRVLRSEGYYILSAATADEAFELLAKNEVGVIVSDQRMPNMTGTEFLARAKELYPQAVRIILSGYTDLDTITASVNQGAVYKFLLKPWDNNELRADLRDAFWKYELGRGVATDSWAAGAAKGENGAATRREQ